MNAYDNFVHYHLLIRRNLETDKLGDEIPEIDIDVVTAKPMLISGIYDLRTSSVVPHIIRCIRFEMWSDEVNRCGFIAAILNVFKLNLFKLNLGNK